MKLKELIDSLITYTPKKDYNFILEQTSNNDIENKSNLNDNTNSNKKVFTNINLNLEYMKVKYNLLVNSDIILREFTLNARGKQFNAFILYIDGMVDSEIMDKFVLEPLMLRNKNNTYDGFQNQVISKSVTNNVTIRKVKKFDLAKYIYSCLIPQNSIKKVSEFEEIITSINSRKLCFIYRYFRHSF